MPLHNRRHSLDSEQYLAFRSFPSPLSSLHDFLTTVRFTCRECEDVRYFRIKYQARLVSSVSGQTFSSISWENPRTKVKGKRFWVPEDAALSVEHEVDGEDNELELQFKWKTRPREKNDE